VPQIELTQPLVWNPEKPILSLNPVLPMLPLYEAGVDAVSFYTGVGGLDFAAEQEGIRTLMASDAWSKAELNYPLNFTSDFLCKNILLTSPQEVLERIHRQRGELSLVYPGPPCPPWSGLNRHRHNLNPDLNLTFYYIDMIKHLHPKCWMMEEVSMDADEVMNAFNEFKCRLKEDLKDYHIQARRVRALYLGTAQDRTRWIFQGWRKDTGMMPSFPRPIKGSLQHLTIGAIAPEIDYIEIKGKRPIRKERTEFFSTIPASEHVDLIYLDGTREPLSKRLDLLLKIFGYPEDFRFHPDLTDIQILRLIGNSVPIPLGRAIFREIVRQLRELHRV
jgi:site-specific DNA-cytosine methylase